MKNEKIDMIQHDGFNLRYFFILSGSLFYLVRYWNISVLL